MLANEYYSKKSINFVRARAHTHAHTLTHARTHTYFFKFAPTNIKLLNIMLGYVVIRLQC